MGTTIALIILMFFGVPLAVAIWLIARAVSAGNRIEELSRRLDSLESEMFRLRQERERQSAKPPEPTPAARPARRVVETISASQPEIAQPTSVPVPPPKPVVPESVIPPLPLREIMPPVKNEEAFANPLPPPRIETARPSAPKINWEQFMGVKGFAWLGGFALFLGVAFFIKYAFDNNLIPPEMRVAIGYLVGLGLIVGGMVMSRKNFPALSQTLCATGVVILYAVTFACYAVYHFAFFSVVPTFLLMALITAVAFVLAVRLDALVVAVLGMLGGFLTPVLLSTGEDNPLALFGYIAILDAGLILVALNPARRNWHFLAALAALGTVVLQIGWLGNFFVSGKYFEGDEIFTALAVLLGFNALWLAANWLAKQRGQINQWLSGPALGLAAATFAFTAWFLDFAPLAQRPWLMFGFVFLIDLAVIAVTLADEMVFFAQAISGLAVFGLLAFWTAQFLSNELLNAALAFYFIFAVLHSTLPAWLQHRRGVKSGVATQPNHFFPPLALLLVLVPIFKLEELSFLVWPFVLVVDLLAIALAVVTATLLPVLIVLALTLAAIGALIFKIPDNLTGLPTSFYLLGAFSVIFVAAGVWLVKKFKPDALKNGIQFSGDFSEPGDLAAMLPACSVVFPFLLLIMATLRLPLADPSPVFGLALLLVVLLLGVTKLFSLDWMPAVGLVCVTAVECAWHFSRLNPADSNQPLNLVLAWYLVFYFAFALFPFLFLRKFSEKIIPWATAAMAGPLQFFLIYRLVKIAWPNQFMGLLPAAFAVPALAGLGVVLKKISAENKSRLAQLAWFGGVALFFITLIFPIQFERQWITIGWALEGAALLWLFHRVPHPGLRLVGIGLLAAAFVRLALNPAVLAYHPRADVPVLNWYLYAYGLVTVCLFAGARLLAPPRHLVLQSNVPPVLAGLGTALAFLLLNIEIADYFSAPGETLTFQFSGNFARDMTYSIAWALFALGLLVWGILKNLRAARYSAMGLLCATLVKLFFHDLAQIGQLYRIGAFVGVAIVAILASFAYQKYFSARNQPANTGDRPPQS